MRLFKMAVAIDQHHGFKPFSRSQRCKLQSFGHLDHNILELTHASFSHSFEQVFEADNIHRSFSTPCLPLSTLSGEDLSTSNPRIEIVSGSGALVHALVVEVAIAMASSVHPKPFPSGLGGAYVFCNKSGNNIALAKPVDEEPLAFNNPKGLGGQKLGQPGLKSSIRIGETGVRELAAYLLDHGGFVGIGILDIRLLNLDRHAGNMLVMKHNHNSYVAGVAADLVSIDHGFCLPEWLDDPYFEWLHRPQASTVAISDNLWVTNIIL
ncbi:putative 1-phosphatidylinositol 4-kinase [Lupinus albus]|uniref:1-phosphatidylinositol 4-kinase n=1 Tax=Lupinus albus TaxID=3870 RepID=A0A6A4NM80_LUPAL|nr:putative 1-phosphatidylinositol 4-kinase [Lupinus albus]